MTRLLPSGAPAPGHAIFDVVGDDHEPVGYLWIGPDTSDDAGGGSGTSRSTTTSVGGVSAELP